LDLMLLIEKIDERPVIVEGKRDKIAMQTLGAGNVISLEGKRVDQLADILEGEKSVVVLTDFDQEGKKLAGRITSFLEKFGINSDVELRREFLKETKKTHIENLIHLKEDDIHGKISAINNKIHNRDIDRSRRCG
jgi:5S rRNA maturation endonuclease (ribonuclease M5)